MYKPRDIHTRNNVQAFCLANRQVIETGQCIRLRRKPYEKPKRTLNLLCHQCYEAYSAAANSLGLLNFVYYIICFVGSCLLVAIISSTPNRHLQERSGA